MLTPARRLLAAFLALVGTAFLAGGLATSAAAAPGDTSPYPVTVCPTITVSTTAPAVGESISVGGLNFLANSDITLVLKPVRDASITKVTDLKTVRSDSQGNFTTTVKLPRGATGTYDITARGGIPTNTANGTVCPADPSARITIGSTDDNRNPNGGPTNTAFTGFNMLWLLLLAAALIALGLYANRRGRSSKNEIRSIHG